VKIRLQVHGEVGAIAGAKPLRAIHVARQLGFFGLYKGVTACLLRDAPWGAIYFPTYAHLKTDLFREGDDGKKLSFWETLAAASIASIPSAFLVTPADFLKTRLQVEVRKGQTVYKGVTDAFVIILRDEGSKVFFTGSLNRVVRSIPQYGVALAAYEYLQKVLATRV